MYYYSGCVQFSAVLATYRSFRVLLCFPKMTAAQTFVPSREPFLSSVFEATKLLIYFIKFSLLQYAAPQCQTVPQQHTSSGRLLEIVVGPSTTYRHRTATLTHAFLYGYCLCFSPFVPYCPASKPNVPQCPSALGGELPNSAATINVPRRQSRNITTICCGRPSMSTPRLTTVQRCKCYCPLAASRF